MVLTIPTPSAIQEKIRNAIIFTAVPGTENDISYIAHDAGSAKAQLFDAIGQYATAATYDAVRMALTYGKPLTRGCIASELPQAERRLFALLQKVIADEKRISPEEALGDQTKLLLSQGIATSINTCLVDILPGVRFVPGGRVN